MFQFGRERILYMSVRVAVAQLRPGRSVAELTERICGHIAEAGRVRAKLAIFPECATTGYTDNVPSLTTPSELRDAERAIAGACADAQTAAVVGTAWCCDDGSWRNSATVIERNGSILGRQHKMQLVPTDKWATPGEALHVFRVAGVGDVSVLICHDKRYPELARLPVLAGSRLLCYLSAEAWHDDRPLVAAREPAWDDARLADEIGAYRAQAQARAVENKVFVAHANWSAGGAPGSDGSELGSHGCSRLITPTGTLVRDPDSGAACEAPIDAEMLVSAPLALLDDADALYAQKSLLDTYALAPWWRAAQPYVRRVGFGEEGI